MTARYTDQLRAELRRKDDEIERLEWYQHHWRALLENASDDSILADTAARMVDQYTDDIHKLRGDIEELEEVIDAEDGERHFRPILV